MAKDQGPMALLVCGVGYVHGAADSGGVAAFTEPLGLSVGGPEAATPRQETHGNRDGWFTSLSLPAQWSQAHLVSLSPTTRRDDLVEKALYRERANRRAEARDESAAANHGQTHGTAATATTERKSRSLGHYGLGRYRGGKVAGADL